MSNTATIVGVAALALAGVAVAVALTRQQSQTTVIRQRDFSLGEKIASTFAITAGGVKDLSSAAFPWFNTGGGDGGPTPTGSR